MKPLTIWPIQTRIFHARESLSDFIVESIPLSLIHDGIVIAVTSKIVSLAEGRLVSRDSIDKKSLVEKEADVYLGEIGHGCFLTIKADLLIPSAGIDESNSESGDYILYPQAPFLSAKNLWHELRRIWELQSLGILLTDSHTTPLRRGVTGVSLSFAGFRALRNLINTPDLFGRKLRMTQINCADGLAASAVMMMGEGAEARPLAVIDNPEIEFSNTFDVEDLHIPFEEDLYFPLLRAFQVNTGGAR